MIRSLYSMCHLFISLLLSRAMSLCLLHILWGPFHFLKPILWLVMVPSKKRTDSLVRCTVLKFKHTSTPFFSTPIAVIAGLNADKQPRCTKLAAATVSGHVPGNVPIRALTVNCWLVQ